MDLERKYWSYLRFIKITLMMTALWPCRSKRTNIICYIFNVYNALCNILMSYVVIYFCWFHINNLEVMMKGVAFLATDSLMCTKLLAFVMYRKVLARLVETLEIEAPTEIKDPKLQPLLLELLPKLSFGSYLQAIGTLGATGLYLAGPLLLFAYQKLSGIPITYFYGLPTKYPWDHDELGGLLYVVHYLFNVTIGWLCYSCIVGSDTLFYLIILQLCGRLRILEHDFQNLKPGSIDYDNNFRDCIRRHVTIIRCRDQLQKVYGFTILDVIVSNAMIMCALVFEASQMKVISVRKVVGFVMHTVAKFLQTFMYSWCGTQLTTKSEAVTYAMYDSDWTSSPDIKTRKNVLMVVSQRPLVLTASHISVVSLHMFTAVLHTTMSYFCLLQTVDKQ